MELKLIRTFYPEGSKGKILYEGGLMTYTIEHPGGTGFEIFRETGWNIKSQSIHMRTFGIILIVLGIIMIIVKGITVTTEKNVVDLGPVKVDRKENKWIGWPTYAGGVIAVVGLALILSDKRSSKT